jgi:hypothetical protein
VQAMCRILRVSRSGFYHWRQHPESPRAREDRKLLVHIRSVSQQSRGRYGSPRVYRALQEQGVRCGKHRVERLMRCDGLQARRRRNFRVTTRSVAGHPVAPNHLDRQFSVARLDTVWAGDITYLWTREGWFYLAALLDLCSRRVVGWACSDRITHDLVLAAGHRTGASRRRRIRPVWPICCGVAARCWKPLRVAPQDFLARCKTFCAALWRCATGEKQQRSARTGYRSRRGAWRRGWIDCSRAASPMLAI